MATLQERFAAMYGKPAQPASAVPESPLAGVTAAPSLSQTDRVAATYASRPAANAPPAARLTAEQQRAARDATWGQLTGVQKFARSYGGPETSLTIPQASLPLAEYKRRTEAAGVDFVVAAKVLDALLANDPSGTPANAKITDVVRARAQAVGIDPDAAQKMRCSVLDAGRRAGQVTDARRPNQPERPARGLIFRP